MKHIFSRLTMAHTFYQWNCTKFIQIWSGTNIFGNIPSQVPSRKYLTFEWTTLPMEKVLNHTATNHWLVADLPLWKIWVRQLGWFFPIYGKIKNVPNHQPDDLCFHPFCMTCWNIFWKRTGWIEQWYRDLESVARLPYQYIPSQRNEDQRKSAYPPVSSNMAGKAPNQMSI